MDTDNTISLALTTFPTGNEFPSFRRQENSRFAKGQSCILRNSSNHRDEFRHRNIQAHEKKRFSKFGPFLETLGLNHS